MKFKDIAIKNFKGNIKKYIIYYLCNSFIVVAFFMYSVLLFNEKLWTTSQIEKGVLQALIVPSVSLGMFSLFFISYAHFSYIRWRKKEFGVFMNLGMTTGDIRKIIIYENTIVALGAILLGILTGVVFSRLFFIIITKLLGVTGIGYIIGFKNFIFSIGIFLGIYSINLIITIITTYNFEIIKLLKEDRKIQNNKFNNPILAVIGIVIFVGMSIFLYKKFYTWKNQDEILLIATILIPVGVYMIISQLGGVLIRLCKKNRKVYYSKLLLITNINSKFKETKKIIFILAILVAVIIFYVGFMLNLCITAEKEAVDTNVYDISYAEIKDKNALSKKKVEKIVIKNNEKIRNHEILEFIYYYGTNESPADEIIMTDKEINKLGKTNLKVSKGNYIFIKQCNELSKNQRKNWNNFNLRLSFNSGICELNNQENVCKAIFNSRNYSYNNINVVNESDYNFIKKQKEGYEFGKFHLYNFNNWKSTKSIVEELKRELDIMNETTKALNPHLSKYSDPLNVASKIGSYNYNKQGAKLLLFSSGFLGIFFFTATSIVLFLKLLADVDRDKKRFGSMYKLGITDEEIKKQIRSELKPLFFIGPIIGIIISFIYTVTFSQSATASEIKYIIFSNIIVSAIFLFIQVLYYFICKKIYCDEILNEPF